MWQSNHHNWNDGGNNCFEPDRNRCDDFDRDRGDRCRDGDDDRHHGGGGWRDQDCNDGGSGHGFFNNDHHGISVFCH
jgi:hypothetical protein